jgi:peptide methionine sulfoxide reductase MsrA
MPLCFCCRPSELGDSSSSSSSSSSNNSSSSPARRYIRNGLGLGLAWYALSVALIVAPFPGATHTARALERPWYEPQLDGERSASGGGGGGGVGINPHGEFGGGGGGGGGNRRRTTTKGKEGEDEQLDVYVGAGCFWHVQHEIVRWEQTALGRSADEITAVVGYAGAALADDEGVGGSNAGGASAVCYNTRDETDYGAMGHTEVVAVKVPRSRLEDFLRDAFFPLFSARGGERSDPQDVGPEYRSSLFLPGVDGGGGGGKSASASDSDSDSDSESKSKSESESFGVHGAALLRAHDAARGGGNNGRASPMKLRLGRGSDPDTLRRGGLVWVLDSGRFPFFRGEVWHQFHDDMGERYPPKYHALKHALLENGRVAPTGCPERRGW